MAWTRIAPLQWTYHRFVVLCFFISLYAISLYIGAIAFTPTILRPSTLQVAAWITSTCELWWWWSTGYKVSHNSARPSPRLWRQFPASDDAIAAGDFVSHRRVASHAAVDERHYHPWISPQLSILPENWWNPGDLYASVSLLQSFHAHNLLHDSSNWQVSIHWSLRVLSPMWMSMCFRSPRNLRAQTLTPFAKGLPFKFTLSRHQLCSFVFSRDLKTAPNCICQDINRLLKWTAISKQLSCISWSLLR